jgi:hypothetical protein
VLNRRGFLLGLPAAIYGAYKTGLAEPIPTPTPMPTLLIPTVFTDGYNTGSSGHWSVVMDCDYSNGWVNQQINVRVS